MCSCRQYGSIAGPTRTQPAPGAHLYSATRSLGSSRASTTLEKAWLAPVVTITSYCGVVEGQVGWGAGGAHGTTAHAMACRSTACHGLCTVVFMAIGRQQQRPAHPCQPVLPLQLLTQRLPQLGQPLIRAVLVEGWISTGHQLSSALQGHRWRLPVHDAWRGVGEEGGDL